MAQRRGPKSKVSEDEQSSADNTIEDDDIKRRERDSWGTILYQTFCPRLPEEGFFGPLDTPYVTPEGARNLKTYKYEGGDNSLVYKHILSPLAEKLVSYLPLWVAPNAITLVSFILSIWIYSVIAYYSWDMESQIPSWVWAANGISILVYQTLDNMDGKQARRTQTGSPLGLLFDHGIDSLNNGLLIINILCMFRTCSKWSHTRSFLAFFGCQLPFVFTTWEEFFIEALYLPVINGPTEGLIVQSVFCFYQAYLGEGADAFWSQDIFGSPLFDYVLAGFMFLGILTLSSSFHNVMKTRRKGFLRRNAFGACIPLLLGMILTTFISFYPDTSIIDVAPRLFFSFLSIIFANLSIHLQLAHIQHMTFYPWRKTFIVPLIILACNNVLRAAGYYIISLELLLKICLIGALISLSKMIFSVIVEVSQALDINVFTVPCGKGKK